MAQVDVSAGATTPGREQKRTARATWYAIGVLILLTLTNALNHLDRKILSILAESIKADLNITDSELGFLYGTVFAALYAVVGIAMGRLCDRWRRMRLMTFGLGLWSSMTALSAFAGNLGQLAGARFGVSLGESVANPAGQSMIPDYFPRKVRATAFGVYLCGGVLGAGSALVIGGIVLANWSGIAQTLGIGDLIRPWQAAFLVCGLPGLILALVLARLKDPARGVFEKNRVPDQPAGSAWRKFFADVATVLPPFSLFVLYRLSPRVALWNALCAAGLLVLGAVFTRLAGDWEQWAGLGIVVYAVTCFAQSLAITDRDFYERSFRSPVFVAFTIAVASASCINFAVQFWAAPYMLRTFDLSHAQVGTTLGVILAGGGVMGVVGGGEILTDYIRRRDVRAAIWVAMAGILISMPLALAMFTTASPGVFLAAFGAFVLVQSMSHGGAAALIQELMNARVRGSGAATFAMLVQVSNFAVGPYTAGKISELTGSLRTGVLSIYVLGPVTLACLVWAALKVRKAVAKVDADAAAA